VSEAADGAAASVARMRAGLGLDPEADADATFDLAETGLRLAALDHPEQPLEPYRDHLGTLTVDLAEAAGDAAPGTDAAALLAQVMVERHGYAGDSESYDDPRNADLMRVIDRRRGLPVALGILYIQAARTRGWTAEGVNFPSHFLIRVGAGSRRAIIDPFDRGRALDSADLRDLLKRMTGGDTELKPEFFASVPDGGVLLRLLNNIKSRALRERDLARALTVAERMVAVEPGAAELWYQFGVLSAHQGNLANAREALETCKLHAADAHLRDEAAAAIARLRRTLN
jgi:regulator of sirC expression with transglutaminase-like and TPR domain